MLLVLFCFGHTAGGMLSEKSVGSEADAVFASMKSVHFTFGGATVTCGSELVTVAPAKGDAVGDGGPVIDMPKPVVVATPSAKTIRLRERCTTAIAA